MLDPLVEGAIHGCTQVVRFDDQATFTRAVVTLLGCHRHHLVVIPGAGLGWAIAVSLNAAACLMDQLTLEDRLRVTSFPMHSINVPEELRVYTNPDT